MLVEGVVDPQHRRDGGGADVKDPGIGDLTVDLHHHLEVFASDDGICGAQKGRGGRLMWAQNGTGALFILILPF